MNPLSTTAVHDATDGHKTPASGRPLRICLVGVPLDCPNLGIGALFYGSVDGIVHRFPDATISVMDFAREGARTTIEVNGQSVPINFVNIRFSKKFYLRNNISVVLPLAVLNRFLPKWLRKKIVAGNPVLQHIEDTDIFASINGGDSFSDIYGLGRLLYVALPQILILTANKPMVLFPQTFGPFKSWIARWIARSILLRAKAVCSRDATGLNTVKELIGSQSADKHHFCFDVGFLVEPVAPSDVDIDNFKNKVSGTALVGLNVSGLLTAGGYSGKNMFGLKVDYTRMLKNLVSHLIEQKDANVILVPHVHAEPWVGGDLESDDRACKELYEAMKDRYPGKLFVLEGNHNAPETKFVIGQCDLFIGSRMHACIGALSQAVPAVALSYSDKFKGVWQTIHLEQLVADPRELDEPRILRIIEEALENRQQLRQHLIDTMPGVKREIEDQIQKLLTSPAVG